MERFAPVGYQIIARPPRFNELSLIIPEGLVFRRSWFRIRANLAMALCNQNSDLTGITMTPFKLQNVQNLGQAEASHISHVSSGLLLGTIFRTDHDWIRNGGNPWFGHISIETSNMVEIFSDEIDMLKNGSQLFLSPIQEYFRITNTDRLSPRSLSDVNSTILAQKILSSKINP
jgi:hypothetical protein